MPAMKKPQECILNGYCHKGSQGISMIWLCKFDKLSNFHERYNSRKKHHLPNGLRNI